MINLETVTKDELLKLMKNANVEPTTLDTRRYVGWGVDDVRSEEVRPDLTENEALDVLDRIMHKHDATLGITWETLRITADELFHQK